MVKFFDRPSFIPPEIKTADIGEYHVFSLDNLPDSLLEKYPDGFVIKQVTAEPIDMCEKFGGDFEVAFKSIHEATGAFRYKRKRKPTFKELVMIFKKNYYNCSARDLELTGDETVEGRIRHLQNLLSPQVIAREHKKRQEFHEQYFADSLPSLVVKSQFIVGEKEPGAAPHVYEIQPKVDFAYRFHYLSGLRDDMSGAEESRIAAQYMILHIEERFDREQVRSIGRQLSVLKIKLEYLLLENKKIVDIFTPGNLGVTVDGTVKLIDTDHLFDAEKKVERRDGTVVVQESNMKRAMKRALAVFGEVVAGLEGE